MIKSHKRWAKTLFLNLNKNIVLKLKKKKKKPSNRFRCLWLHNHQLEAEEHSWGHHLRGRGLGGLVSSHFFVYFLKIKVLQIHSSRVLDKVLPQELKSFEVPIEEHSIVLFSLLKSLNGLSSNGLEFLLHCLEPFILFHHQLSFNSEVIPHDLDLSFYGVGLIHSSNQVFLQL